MAKSAHGAVIKQVARVLAGLMLLFYLIFIVDEGIIGEGPRRMPTFREKVWLFFLVVSVIGLLLAWRLRKPATIEP